MGSTIIITFIVKYFNWAFLGWILITLMQRRHGSKGIQKRMAVLYQAIIIFLVLVYGTILKMNEFTDIYLSVALIAVVAVLYFGRKRILPYKKNCRECGKKMDFERIFFYDEPLCRECDKVELEEKEEIRKQLKEMDEEE